MRITEKNAMHLRVEIGTGSQGGQSYEMSLINGATPAVKSLKTGRTFILSWEDIVQQAQVAGVDNEPEVA